MLVSGDTIEEINGKLQTRHERAMTWARTHASRFDPAKYHTDEIGANLELPIRTIKATKECKYLRVMIDRCLNL